jgi:signal transduction histidine kinase/ActR/RegA family two-component response regulator
VRVLDIRTRMLIAALLPLVLVSSLLALVFLLARFDDMQESYQQRTRSVARQIALASEYGLFSGNQPQLQALVRGALREPDVRWVAIMDGEGRILVNSGDDVGEHAIVFGVQETQGFDARRRVDWLTQPVFASGLRLDDIFSDKEARADGLPAQLGQVVVKFSRQSVDDRKRDMLWLGGLIGVIGLVFGMLLAAYLSRGVIRPIMRVSRLIERIGRGDFSATAEVRGSDLANDPLFELQRNLHQMAGRLASTRDDMEQQIGAATQALRERKEEAERANQAKSHFLAAASHDLRQPIHALGMFVTRLTQLPHDDQTGQLIRSLEASVVAMQNLLDGLLDVSRLEAQAVHVNKEAFALATLFDQLGHDLAQTAFDRGLRLRIRPTSLWVRSDATLLYRMLLNLVGNALRYTERGGVLVAARPVIGTELVQLQVWDTGIGIAPEHQTAVFSEFYQVANAARDRSKGLGLGLNIVQRTAALLDHPLTLVSRLGRGTCFSLTLPVVAARANPPAEALTERSGANDLLGVPVLVIEDDVLVRQALVGLLVAWGLRVSEAQGLTQAQEHLDTGLRPALIISDYRLQEGCHGIEVVQLLRAHLGSDVPACLMSGDTDPALIQAAMAAGLTLLHKPVRPAKLRNLLRRLLLDQRGEVERP